MSGMYSVKPYTLSSEPELPTNMYRVEPVALGPNAVSSGAAASTSASNLPQSWKQLEERQTNILSQLSKLNETIKKYAKDNNLNLTASATTTTTTTAAAAPSGPVDESIPIAKRPPSITLARQPAYQVDAAVQCSPQNPALATLAISKLLGDQVTIRYFWHSSLGVPPPNFVEIQRAAVANTQAKARLTIIWSNVPQPTLTVTPSSQVPIVGDFNAARYFCRLFRPDLIGGSDIALNAQIDQWVDNAQAGTETNKEYKKVLKDCNSQLGKAPFLCGSLSLADIALWSLVKTGEDQSAPPSNIKTLFTSLGAPFEEALAVVATVKA